MNFPRVMKTKHPGMTLDAICKIIDSESPSFHVRRIVLGSGSRSPAESSEGLGILAACNLGVNIGFFYSIQVPRTSRRWPRDAAPASVCVSKPTPRRRGCRSEAPAVRTSRAPRCVQLFRNRVGGVDARRGAAPATDAPLLHGARPARVSRSPRALGL